jgi:hypothetical protein
MNIGKILAVWAALAAFAVGIRAQEHDVETRDRFYIGPRLHFNVSAKLQNIPAAPNTGPGYDDGYVDEDISKNAGGKTWNWGYKFTNQIFGTFPNQELELHGANSPRDNVIDHLTDEPQIGFEMGYGHEFWRFGREEYPIRVGFEAGFSASEIGLSSRDTVSGPVTRISDRYSLAGIVPPTAPYNGLFEGPAPPNPPGPLISTNRLSRTTSTETATSTQHSSIEGTYWGFRLGPFIEIPWPGYRHSFQFGMGVSMVNVDAKLSYEENFTITGLGGPPPAASESASRSDWLFGFYVNAKAYYWVNDVVALYVGGEFQSLDNFKLSVGNKAATVDFGTTAGLTLGVMYVF